MRQFMGAFATLCLVACGNGGSTGRLPDGVSKADSASAEESAVPTGTGGISAPSWSDMQALIFDHRGVDQPRQNSFDVASTGPLAGPIATALTGQAEALETGIQAFAALQALSIEAASRPEGAATSSVTSDQELAKLVEQVSVGLQNNPVTNGTLATAVRQALQHLELSPLLTRFGATQMPDPAAVVRSKLKPLVNLFASGADPVTTLTQVLIFDFATVSDGVVRTHKGILNVPIPLDVDSQLGPDVIATLSLLPKLDGGATLTMRVNRVLPNAAPFSTLVGKSLPLDIRARILVPVSNLSGQNDPNLRVDLGFVSTSSIASSTDIELAFNPGQSGGAAPALGVTWNTRQPGSDLSLVVDGLQQNAATGSFDKLFGLTLANAPVPDTVSFDLTLGQLLDFVATTSAPTSSRLMVDVPGNLAANLAIGSLPSSLNITLGNDGEGFLVRYLAASAIPSLTANLQLAAGPKLDLSLLDIPNQLNARIRDPRTSDGGSINVNFGGQSIGEIAFTLVDGDVPRPVGENTNGFILDSRRGLTVGARLQGFRSLVAVLTELIYTKVEISTGRPFFMELYRPVGERLNVSLSNIPSIVTVQATRAGQGLDLNLQSSSQVSDLGLNARFGGNQFTASLAPLPPRVDICLAIDNNRCTGATPGSVIDASLSTSIPFRLGLDACLDCFSDNPATFVLNPLRAQNLALSIDIQDGVGPIRTTPYGKGNIWFSSANWPIEIVADARFDPANRLPPISLNFDFQGSANNRRVTYDLGPVIPRFNRSGDITCNRTIFDLRVGSVDIGGLIERVLGKLLCNDPF